MRPVAQGGCAQAGGRCPPVLAAIVLALLAGAGAAPSAGAAAGDIHTAAGNGSNTSSGDGGPATSAGTGGPEGVWYSSGGFHLVEGAGPRVRYVDASGTISTTAGGGTADPGDGGPATAAVLNAPEQLVRDRDGNVYFTHGNRVRRVSPLGIITTVAGTGVAGYSGDGGPATAAQVNRPHGLALDLAGNLYVGDCDNFRVRRIAPLGVISTVAGTGIRGYTGNGGPAIAARLDCPVDVAIDSYGRLLIADNGNHAVRLVDAGGVITTIAGTGTAGYAGDGGPATAARLRQPQGLDVDGAGSLYIAEAGNHVIRKVDAGGTISTVAGTGVGAFSGDGGPALLARLNGPRQVSFDYATGDFYIADRFNNRVRRVEALGVPNPPPGVTIDSEPASPGNDPTPSWSFSASSPAQVVYECRLARGATVVSDWTSCASPTTYDLTAAVDGDYFFSARAVSLSGAGTPASRDYVLDRVPPAAPILTTTPGALGNDSTPTWSFDVDAGAAAECRLERGASVISDWQPCSGAATYDLSDEPDGGYRFLARAVDAAGNVSLDTASDYELDTTPPGAPTIDSWPGAAGSNRMPWWGFSGEPGAVYECRLRRGRTVVDGWAPCAGRAPYDLAGAPHDTYTFEVRGRDAAGNLGPAARSDYELRPPPPDPDDEPPKSGDRPSTGGEPAPTGPTTPAPAGPAGDALPSSAGAGLPPFAEDGPARREPRANRSRDRDRAGGVGIPLDEGGVTRGGPPVHVEAPERGETLGKRMFGALGEAAGWVGRNLDKTGFPLLLVLLVAGYMAVQNRLDRRDPKLALAPVHADRDLEFLPPSRFADTPPGPLTP